MKLKIIAELEPTRNREKLLKRVRQIAPHVDAIDIPEAPMGVPIASASVLAAHLAALYPSLKFIPHIRVIDVNRVGLLSLIGGIKASGIDEAVLLRGDQPVEGKIVDDINVEEAARYVKERIKHPPRLGAMLSMRHPFEKIIERVHTPLDFYMVLRPLHDVEKLVNVSREAHRMGKKLYAYIIVGGENYEKLRSMLDGQPVYRPEEVVDVARRLADIVDGVIVSSPGSVSTVVEAVQRLSRAL